MQEKQQRLGARIRSLRQARGLTQEQLAERAGLHPTYVAKIEAGTRLPSLEVLDRLAAALEVPASLVVQAIDAAALPEERAAEEVEILLQGCSAGQVNLVLNFIELVKRYEVSEK